MNRINLGSSRLTLMLLAAALLMLPAMALSQGSEGGKGAIIRLGGDAVVAAGESADAVIVIGGNARIAGHAQSVTVIDGIATIEGGEVGDLAVIDGRADARDGSTITGDVTLINAEIDRALGAHVLGTIHRDSGYRISEGFRIFGMILGIGAGIALLVGGLLVAAIAPIQARRISETITEKPGLSALAALAAWVVIPTAAIIMMFTVVGIPLGIALLMFVFPALAFVGYLATGIRLGDYLMEKMRGASEAGRPYLAALLGIGILVLVGWVPVLGSLLSFVAAFIGTGAIVLTIVRGFGRKNDPAISVSTGGLQGVEGMA